MTATAIKGKDPLCASPASLCRLPVLDRHMASGLSSDFPPPSSPTPPLLVEPPPEDIDRDVDDGIEIDLDDCAFDRPVSRASATSSTGNWNDIDGLFPSRNSAALLSPDFLSPNTPRSIRRPGSSMSTDSVLSETGLVPAAPAPGPFNFQTQSMSTSPVKSVCYPPPPKKKSQHKRCAGRALLTLTAGYRTLASAVATDTSTPP